MKLTKSQRHTAYIILRQEAEWIIEHMRGFPGYTPREWGYFYGGLCWLIERTIGINYNLLFFPELLRKGPHLSDYRKLNLIWFPVNLKGWMKRAELLDQSIEETADF